MNSILCDLHSVDYLVSALMPNYDTALAINIEPYFSFRVKLFRARPIIDTLSQNFALPLLICLLVSTLEEVHRVKLSDLLF